MFRFGIIGAGYIANKFCRAVELLPEVCVSAVASSDLARAREFAGKYGVENAYGDYEQMLKSGQVDGVYIASLMNRHYEHILLCLRHGLPVLCEKCMVLTKAQGEEVFRQAREKNLFVMEAMWSRFLPAVLRAKEWIDKGRIGQVRLINYNLCVDVPPDSRIVVKEKGGGCLYDLGVYPIEILSYLAGRPLIDAQGRVEYENGVDVFADVSLLYEGGIHGGFQVGAHVRAHTSCMVYGSEGSIELAPRGQDPESCELRDKDGQVTERFFEPLENGFEYEIQEAVDCIRAGKLSSPTVPWSATLSCLDVFEALLRK